MRSPIAIILLGSISIALTNYYQEPTSASNQQPSAYNSLQALNTKKAQIPKPRNRGSGRVGATQKAFIRS